MIKDIDTPDYPVGYTLYCDSGSSPNGYKTRCFWCGRKYNAQYFSMDRPSYCGLKCRVEHEKYEANKQFDTKAEEK